MGASVHRLSKSMAIGGKPPYLRVIFIFVLFHPLIFVVTCSNRTTFGRKIIFMLGSHTFIEHYFLFFADNVQIGQTF